MTEYDLTVQYSMLVTVCMLRMYACASARCGCMPVTDLVKSQVAQKQRPPPSHERIILQRKMQDTKTRRKPAAASPSMGGH